MLKITDGKININEGAFLTVTWNNHWTDWSKPINILRN
jgi:hypothetical protein